MPPTPPRKPLVAMPAAPIARAGTSSSPVPRRITFL